MALTLRTIADNVNRHLRNAGARDLSNISQDDRDEIIKDAVRKYSRVRPVISLAAQVSNGTSFYNLPADWDDEFSNITEIEYKIEQTPPSLIDKKYYKVDTTASGKQLRFLSNNPATGDTFWIKFTTMHRFDSGTYVDTIPETDLDVISYVGAFLLAQAFAGFYASKADANLTEVEIVGYDTRVAEFNRVAEKFIAKYESELQDDNTGVYGNIDFLRDQFFDRDTD